MTAGTQRPEPDGDMILSLCDRQDRLYARLDRKIGKMEQRVTMLEERGRE